MKLCTKFYHMESVVLSLTPFSFCMHDSEDENSLYTDTLCTLHRPLFVVVLVRFRWNLGMRVSVTTLAAPPEQTPGWPFLHIFFLRNKETPKYLLYIL